LKIIDENTKERDPIKFLPKEELSRHEQVAIGRSFPAL